MRPIYLVIICFTINSALASDTLNLQDAISIALKNHYGILIAKNQIQAAENTRTLARAGMLPTVDAAGGYTLTHKDVEQDPASPTSPNGVTTSNTLNGQVALNWVLFDGFRMFKAYSLVHATADYNSQSARVQIETAIAQVIQAYWNLSAQQAHLHSVKSQIEISVERVSRQMQRQAMGALSTRELLKARVDLNADSARLIDQELALVLAQNQLNMALGKNIGQSVYAQSEIPVPEQIQESKYWISMAKENNQDFLHSRIKLKVTEQNKGIQDSKNWPMLSLGANYGYTDVSNTLPTQASQNIGTWQGQIGLTVRWNIFNGFQDRINIQNSAIDVQNAQTELKRKELFLESQVSEQHQKAQQALMKLAFENSSLSLTRQSYAVAEEQYKMGQQSAMEFREAQQQLLSAELRLVQAKLQARLAITELERLVGLLAGIL